MGPLQDIPWVIYTSDPTVEVELLVIPQYHISYPCKVVFLEIKKNKAEAILPMLVL